MTRLAYFYTIMATYYCTKVAQMFTNFWAIIKMSLLKRKTALATFGQLLGNIGPLSIPVSGHTDGRAKIWYSSLKYFFASCPLLKLFPFCHLPPKNHIFSFYCSNGPTSSQQASHCSLILFQEGRAGGGILQPPSWDETIKIKIFRQLEQMYERPNDFFRAE